MLPFIETPELVFGFCSPIGTDNTKIKRIIRDHLLKYKYETIEFKVTELMRNIVPRDMTLVQRPFEDRYDTHIKYANELRFLYEDSGVLGMICCGAIRSHRRKTKGKPDAFVQRVAYIFDQFKRREEVDVLRQIYGQLFILVSVYSNTVTRHGRLVERIAESHTASRPKDEHESMARRLMVRDEDEERVPTGQRLRETFPLADIFVDVDEVDHAEKTISRFLQALFGAPDVSPTPSEWGMYLAKSAALRSMDMSRQIGAAIVEGAGDLVTVGCNEVPKAGGGLYWTADTPDGRDYPRGHDENDRLKRAILVDVVKRLVEENLVQTQRDTNELVDAVLTTVSTKGSLMRDAELMDLLEFGRIIHAEMAALCDAARTGKRVSGAVLYCTTFPCHICAKHIVASGISRVVFIEPYPKSYAEQLHSDSIVVKTGECPKDKVQFEPFIGIAPARYRDLFARERRKDSFGKALKWEEEKATPGVRLTIATYLENEKALLRTLNIRLQALQREGKVTVLQEGNAIVSIDEVPTTR